MPYRFIAGCFGITEILDYSQSEIVVIENGVGKIQTGSFRVLHFINLDECAHTLENIKNDLENNVPASHPLLPFLLEDIKSLSSLIHRLTPKKKQRRSINAIGTAWKWIAGNPDHEDFRILTDKINNVIENNNNQIVINKNMVERINNITEMSNTIVKALKNSEILQNTFILHVKYKIEIIKEELNNINMAIHLAKSNIVNTFIISEIEIAQIEKVFLEEDIPFKNIEEAFNFADIKIACNNNSLIYVIVIPKTLNVNCRTLTLKPVKKNNFIVNTEFEKIVKCNKEIYGVKNECKIINDVTICLKVNIKNITNDDCISKIIANASHNCTISNSEHVKEIEEIDTGMLLLNNYYGNVTIDNVHRNLSGTYLIKFSNSSIQIGNTKFTAEESTYFQPLPAMLQHSHTRDDIEEVLSLQFLKTLHVKSNQKIEKLNFEFKSSLFANFGLTTAIIISLIVVLMKPNVTSGQPITRLPQAIKQSVSLYDIPYF